MTLEKLLEGIDYKLVSGSLDVDIQDVVYDSRKAGEMTAFVCISGSKLDSHDFIPQVVEAGCPAVIISKDIEIANATDALAVVRVEDSRRALALMSANLFGHPTRRMKVIGITGTKGKTTTTHMLKAILEEAGAKVGTIGTNGADIDGIHYKTVNTTPESYELQKLFARMNDSSCRYAIMEVSSQGIMMNRVAGVDYDIGAFTNVSPDHIGPNEHKSFEEYLSYKAKLLTLCKKGLVNADDENFEGMIAGHTCELHTFSKEAGADFYASDIKSVYNKDFMGVSFTYHGSETYEILLDVPGIFNVENALTAVAIADMLGIKQKYIVSALKKVKVAGRMELAHVSEHCSVVIDYAHNGVSARSMLGTLKEYEPKRLVVVFGCGGDRAATRRYDMGEAVGALADLAIITTDNPRFEDPANIIKDIHQGLDPSGIATIEILDRREAIAYAIEHSEPGDMIAIIGKGHEDYQEIRGERTHLSDSEEVAKTIERLGW